MTALHSIRQGIPLAIEGIGKAFGEREVLQGIDLQIPAGQFVAVVGRSGCGKSTLLGACWPGWTSRAGAPSTAPASAWRTTATRCG